MMPFKSKTEVFLKKCHEAPKPRSKNLKTSDRCLALFQFIYSSAAMTALQSGQTRLTLSFVTFSNK